MTWTLVEPCCGTAALTLHLLGARRQLVPRQGSKWALRRVLAERAAALGFEGAPSRIVLSDAAPWAIAMQQVLGNRAAALDRLRFLVMSGELNPVLLHQQIHGQPVPGDPTQLAAELLWLQRMAYAGKAVRVVDWRWSSPGLNLTSALGVAATDKFGEVRPLGPALTRAVEAAPVADVEAVWGMAPVQVDGPTLVYLDPPYAGTTGYGATLTRSEVVDLAERWAAAGAAVIVSEAGPVSELAGWSTRSIGKVGGQDPTQLFRARHRSEWLTCSVAP